jgi:hypothetical protein
MEIKVFSKNKRFLSLVETSKGKFIQHVHGYFIEAREIKRDFFIHYDYRKHVWAVHDHVTAYRITAAKEYRDSLEEFKKAIETFDLNSLKNFPAINPE